MIHNKKETHIIAKSRFQAVRIGILCIMGIIAFMLMFIPGWSYVYTRSIYPIIGKVLSTFSGLFPFAIGDLFIAGSIAWIIGYSIYALFTRRKKLWLVVEYIAWVFIWFYLAWGINYAQPNIYQRMDMKPAEVSKTQLKDFADRYIDSLNYYYDARMLKKEKSASNVDDKLKDRVTAAVLQGYNRIGGANTSDQSSKSVENYGINRPFTLHPHVKTMVFSWLSSMAGVTGSMGPFFCEYTLNGDLLPHEYPATYAHEFAHFLGIANEGEANFYSYVVCTSSTDKVLKFSGYYHILYYVLNNVYNIFGEKAAMEYMKKIRPEIIQLAQSDQKYWHNKRFQPIDTVQDYLFELYLRGNHVAEGRKSYSGVIAIILAWQNKKNQTPA